jgi:predicted N-acetyltransferase YhbS
MTSLVVRSERSHDRDAALEVEHHAFGGPDEAAIVEAVRDLPGSFALIAEEDGAVVGHVQLSRAWIGERAVVPLGPIGVSPERQGAGIGSALVRAALAEASRRGEAAMILLGSQQFYPRFGFRPGPRSGSGTRSPG